ncbi:hypothetical protein GCM10010191_59400 [Actinomadura vinacea]|uniref:Uncharacterized protein n=1 Tax=Actinomadura vinacea TaxID=115336 RepID=A0ABP5WUW3_9ACTN
MRAAIFRLGREDGVLAQARGPAAVRVARPHPAPGLNPREPARYPAHQDLERLLPAGRIYAVPRGHHKIFSLHTSTISGGRTRQSADLY